MIINFESVFGDAGIVDEVPYVNLRHMWDNDQEAEVLQILAPEIDKLRGLTRADFEATTLFKEMTDQEVTHYNRVVNHLFGDDDTPGRLQLFIENFDRVMRDYG